MYAKAPVRGGGGGSLNEESEGEGGGGNDVFSFYEDTFVFTLLDRSAAEGNGGCGGSGGGVKRVPA